VKAGKPCRATDRPWALWCFVHVERPAAALWDVEAWFTPSRSSSETARGPSRTTTGASQWRILTKHRFRESLLCFFSFSTHFKLLPVSSKYFNMFRARSLVFSKLFTPRPLRSHRVTGCMTDRHDRNSSHPTHSSVNFKQLKKTSDFQGN